MFVSCDVCLLTKKEIFIAPALNMASRNLILSAVQQTTMHGLRLAANLE